MRNRHEGPCGPGGITMGLIFMTIGVMYLLDNMNLLEGDVFRRWWPVLLIIAGVSKLLFRRSVYRSSEPEVKRIP